MWPVFLGKPVWQTVNLYKAAGLFREDVMVISDSLVRLMYLAFMDWLAKGVVTSAHCCDDLSLS